jgi:AcrR family transcriptional regulator
MTIDGDSTIDPDITSTIGRPPAAERLLAATVAAIDEGGESNVKVQDIADAAGVQIPILYRKYGSRDGLIQAAHIARLSRQLQREMSELAGAMAKVNTAEEFAALLEAVLRSVCSSERRDARMKRVNIIGSSYGRPALAKAISEAQQRAISNIAGVFKRPQEQGWLRQDLDLDAVAAWIAGTTLGRIVIEVGDSDADDEAWDAIFADAVRHVLLP